MTTIIWIHIRHFMQEEDIPFEKCWIFIESDTMWMNIFHNSVWQSSGEKQLHPKEIQKYLYILREKNSTFYTPILVERQWVDARLKGRELLQGDLQNHHMGITSRGKFKLLYRAEIANWAQSYSIHFFFFCKN